MRAFFWCIVGIRIGVLNKKVICNCCSHFQCSAVLPCSWRKLVLPGLLGHLRQMSAASSPGSKPTAGGGEPDAAGSTTRKDTAASSGHTAGPASTTSVKAPAAAGGLPAGTEAAAATSGPAGKDAAGSAVTSFDPDSVLPKDMDFVPWVPKEMSHKAEKCEKKGDTSLAKRLMLGAFSTSVGWRPTGLNLGQARLFIERFPSEFRLGAMSKVVMPCCKGKAFVCPDGKLPCPFLSTCSALKVIEKKKDIAGDCDPRAWKDIQRVLEKGVQVEWVEFDDYMSYMIYCEGIAVQSDVVVKPHILDTALMFLGFCKSKRGRALQAQAAAGIDAAAAEVDPQNQHGEGAKNWRKHSWSA